MSIDPEDQNDRTRMRFSFDYYHRQLEVYRRARRETVMNISGSPEFAESMGVSPGGKCEKPWGNLLQQSAIANSIMLAYKEPRYTIAARTPDADPIAPIMEEFLNRYSKMINLGRIARELANDAFLGYAIAKTAIGVLPPGARQAIYPKNNFTEGPMCWRVSQDNFIYDGSALSWDYVSYMGDMVIVPLDEAKKFQPFLDYNQEGTEGLQEYTFNQNTTDSRIHVNAQRRFNAQAVTRLLHVYLPHSGLEVYWPCNYITFNQVANKPLLVRKWTGHHNGPYTVASLLDIPDNLVPVSVSESTKQLHYLFNELVAIGANQAREAKVVPVYEIGSQKDMQKLEDADDRKAVGVSNIQKIGQWEKPGPTQSQNAYAMTALQLYKEFSGNTDDILGNGPTAPTATQSALIRQRTNVRMADYRGRMNEMMKQIGEKLAHLALNDENLELPMRKALGGVSDVMMDVSWRKPSEMPRPMNITEYDLDIIPESMEYKDPEARLTEINEAMTQILTAAQVIAQGAPMELEKIIDIQARYRDLPELRNIYSSFLEQKRTEMMQAQGGPPAAGGGGSIPDPNKGNYTRTNVSERSGQGALTQLMSQIATTDPSSGITTPAG